jgi:hypothetical protein
MKIRVYIICILILLPFIGHAGLAQNPRDLTRYDDGGAFEEYRMMPKLRCFLWEHWTQKRLAHVVVTLYSIEGDPTTYNLFIEPDRDQRWRVVAEYESECCWVYEMEKPKRKREREKGVQTSGSDQATLSLIPEGDSREPDSYILRCLRLSLSAST